TSWRNRGRVGRVFGRTGIHSRGCRLGASSRGDAAGGRFRTGSSAGVPLGDFRIVREIGRGGMGVVYEAVQISLGRRVALKVLPFAAAMDPKQLPRFKYEAKAAAHLHHTNIVPVFGVGSERGVHYYAMQFIEGQTLAQVIADLRSRIADLPSRQNVSGRESRIWAASAARMPWPSCPRPN